MKDYGGCGNAATYGTVCKVMMTLMLVAWWLLGPKVGFYPVVETDWHTIETIREHLLWPLSHANMWHLAGNLWVLWCLRGERLYMQEAYVIAVLCSFLPVVPGLWEMMGAADGAGTVATCGFSGVLCAMIGVKWGTWIRSCGIAAAYRTFCMRVLPFVTVGFLIPHVNWSIHLYCLVAGVVYGMVAAMPQHTERR